MPENRWISKIPSITIHCYTHRVHVVDCAVQQAAQLIAIQCFEANYGRNSTHPTFKSIYQRARKWVRHWIVTGRKTFEHQLEKSIFPHRISRAIEFTIDRKVRWKIYWSSNEFWCFKWTNCGRRCNEHRTESARLEVIDLCTESDEKCSISFRLEKADSLEFCW